MAFLVISSVKIIEERHEENNKEFSKGSEEIKNLFKTLIKTHPLKNQFERELTEIKNERELYYFNT